ncbi:MAG TPA: PAS domain-containing sensor histidine kinase [Candidatus Thermoplasmatota archaeon]|nr:PAS domain-containing sensor histidine kinase [Candidatus Thermoplasmatota archaeon]
MAEPQAGPAGKRSLSAFLQPKDGLPGPERRRARVALVLLAALVLVSLLSLTFTLTGAYGGGDVEGALVQAITVVGLGFGFVLARNGRVTLGVVVALALVEGTVLHVHTAGGEPAEVSTLYFTVVPILAAGLLLPVRAAVVAVVATILVTLLVELQHHDTAGLHSEDYGLLLLLVATGVLAVAGAALFNRDARLLAESEALLLQITENLPEVLFVVAADGSRALYTSPGYQTMTGRTVQQSLADPLDWLKAVHPDDLAHVQAQMQARAVNLEYRIVHQGTGEVKHVRARTFPVLDAEGKLGSLVGIVEDVTPAVVANQRLRESQRQRIHLLQQLAHDLASPLSPVKIQLRLLQDHVPADRKTGLAIVKRNVDHIQRLVEDIKDVARLEGGDLRLDRRPTDLAALARQAAETLAPSAAERQVEVALDAPAALPLHADAGRLTQVLYNLVGNALKFTPAGGRVELQVATLDGLAEVRVRDTGAGMRPDQLERLFKPFSQVHDPAAAKKPEDKGSGLGLYISKGIVEAHGGSVAAESGGPGHGSTFTFRLPVAPPADGPV